MTPPRLRITETAQADLAEIWAFIAADNRRAADRFVHQIVQRFEPLCLHPELGPRRDRYLPGLRVHFYRSYAMYYTFTESELIIARVLHGARDARALLGVDESK